MTISMLVFTVISLLFKGSIMTKILLIAISTLTLLIAQAHANVEVNFYESAPKDSFVIKNTGNCQLDTITLKIDLTQSAGKLIFDTTSTGAGVEVFQPFEITKGNISLSSEAGIKDGDAVLELLIPSLTSGESVSFTIDVDDTLPVSKLGKIRVAGSEIENGMVQISSENQETTSATFGDDSKATIINKACASS